MSHELAPAVKKFSASIAELVHADRKRDAALTVAEFCKIPLKLDGDNPAKYIPILVQWLHWLLNNGAPFEAAKLLWTPNLFDDRPQFTKDVWKFFDETSQGLIMGGASCSKSFSVGARLMLEWIRDPDWTMVTVAGPSEKHLKKYLFSSLVRLHKQASLPMPGVCGELFIGTDRKNQAGSITGEAIPLGRQKKSGRIQGAKCVQRPYVHPIFGEQSRMFILLDEVENIPEGIWDDIANVLSQVSDNVGNFKIIGAFNPVNPAHEVGRHVEPINGWGAFDPDKDFRWKSKLGWNVLRLDGEKCENVVQGRKIFPGLQTREGLEALAKESGGRQGAKYASQGRGCYPTQGAVASIIPTGMFAKARGTFLWYSDPVSVSSLDLALEGGDAAIFTHGLWGLASGMKLSPTLEYPEGRTIMFKNRLGQVTPRHGLLAKQQFPLAKGDSIDMAERSISMCKKLGTKPILFCCDRTGVGSGAADIIKRNWGAEIHAVNYTEGPSESKLMLEDTKTCAEEYDRLHSELLYALRAFMEYGYLLLSPELDITELQVQCTDRLVKHGSIKSRVEAKKDYKDRHGGRSPNEMDSLSLLVHAARRGSGVILSRLGESVSENDDDDGWYDGSYYPGGARIDVSNRNDVLLEGA